MGYLSWKEEFMPIPIAKVKDTSAWILRKWTGARAYNLKKHDMTIVDGELRGKRGCWDEIFKSENCPWCIEDNGSDCRACPAVMAGLNKCANTFGGAYIEKHPPYTAFVYENDPEPMIQWIEQAIELINEGN